MNRSFFATAAPGHEDILLQECNELGFIEAAKTAGGVTFHGSREDGWRANLWLRTAIRILERVADFRAPHLAQLDKRARRVAWADILRPDVPVFVRATSRRSRVYHSGAIKERIERAISEELGAPIAENDEDGLSIAVFARLDDDNCTLSVDLTGTPLYKRGYKLEVGKAPMRETLAAAFLIQCGHQFDEPVIDPMCGSGTFVLEAALRARSIAPGLHRTFAFEKLPRFDAGAWEALRRTSSRESSALCYGSDRDAGAISMAKRNAERAGLDSIVRFEKHALSDLRRPSGPPGLLITNPPYGERIGAQKGIERLYRSLGGVLKERFSGWRAALITSDRKLAHSTGLPFRTPGPPVPHGGLRVQVFLTHPLP